MRLLRAAMSNLEEKCPQLALAAIFVLAIVRGGMYASFMPPWGLIDEEQHVHYIQYLAQERTLPVVGQAYLSPEIVNSLFATQRWAVFHWAAPGSRDPREMGLEGHSYEAFQPPLFYLLMAPVFASLPDEILVKVFALRWVAVGLSLLTVYIAYRVAADLFPKDRVLPPMIALLLIAIPERTMAVSQVNNDVLLEVIAAAFIWVATHAILRGLTVRRAQYLGLLLGLGILTKTSMAVLAIVLPFVFWRAQATGGRRVALAWTGGIAGVLVLPVVVRNLLLYGDLLGFAGFQRLGGIGTQPPGFTIQTVLAGISDLFCRFWVIWWRGATVGGNPALNAIYLALALATLLAGAGLARVLRANRRQPTEGAKINVVLMYLLAILAVATAVLASWLVGSVPEIQGRLLLPVIVPVAVLLGWGIWQFRFGKIALVATVLTLLAADAFSLFGNLLRYFYYWSAFFVNGIPVPFQQPGLQEGWTLFYTRFLSDKPAVLWPILPWLLPIYVAALVLAAVPICLLLFPGSRAIGAAIGAILRDRLIWIAAVLAIAFLAWTLTRPSGVLWSLDEGGKLLYMESTLKTGNPAAPLIYPGRSLDPELRFVPLFYRAQAADQIYSWWPVAFPLLTLPLYLLLGWTGLYVIPAVSGATCALLSGLIVRQACPVKPKLAVAALLISAAATPVLFYSTTFWEHAPAAALLLGAIWLAVRSQQTQKVRWLLLAGVLASWSTLLRTEDAALAAGLGLALLLWRWRWGLLFGTTYVLACLPWLLTNWVLMGNVFSRQWQALMGSPASGGISAAPLLFVPYLLFNAPLVGAFELSPVSLSVGTVLSVMGIIAVFIKRLRWAVPAACLGLAIICGSVLFEQSGYRSVHGFLLIAPHVVAGAWLFASRSTWERTLFPAIVLAGLVIFGVVFVARAWLAAGGLQWGPRYLLALYPLLVAASVAGLGLTWTDMAGRLRRTVAATYVLLVLIGLGYQVRGAWGANQVLGYYAESRQAIEKLLPGPIATGCTWLPMVAPDLYWTGSVFAVTDPQQLTAWKSAAWRAGERSYYMVEMDACSTTPLDQVADGRRSNPSGLAVQRLSLDGSE